MAFGDKLRDWPLVQSSCDEEDDVVDHVAVRDEVQEGGQVTCNIYHEGQAQSY